MERSRFAGYCGPIFYLQLKGERVAGGGVEEGDAAGMEMKPGPCACFCPYAAAAAVEEVAKNRSAEAAEVG